MPDLWFPPTTCLVLLFTIYQPNQILYLCLSLNVFLDVLGDYGHANVFVSYFNVLSTTNKRNKIKFFDTILAVKQPMTIGT